LWKDSKDKQKGAERKALQGLLLPSRSEPGELTRSFEVHPKSQCVRRSAAECSVRFSERAAKMARAAQLARAALVA
jgi:hypothetical protein